MPSFPEEHYDWPLKTYAWPRFLLLLGHTSKFFLKISITPLTDEIVFARIELTTKEEAKLMQKQEKCLQKPLTSCLVPNEILTDGKNWHFKVVASHPSLTKGKCCGVHLLRLLPMGITPSPFRERKAAALWHLSVAQRYLVGNFESKTKMNVNSFLARAVNKCRDWPDK